MVLPAGQETQLAWQRMALPVISALHFQKAAARRTQSSVTETPQASPSEPERGPGAAHALAWAFVPRGFHPVGAMVPLQKCAHMRRCIAPLLRCARLCSLLLDLRRAMMQGLLPAGCVLTLNPQILNPV